MNFCELDKFAIKSYCAVHNVDESLNLGDITKVDEKMLPKDIDLITYGFPCQDISLAGKKKGLFNEDGSKTRSGLFFEALRVIEEVHPKVAIAENVKNLTSKRFEKQFKIVLDSLETAGYNNYWKVLNAKNFGIPQNRERVFIISIRKDIDNGMFKFPEGFPLKIRLKDILEDKVDDKFYLTSDKALSLIKKITINQNTTEVIPVGNVNPSGKGQNGAVIDSQGIARTITIEKGEGQKVLVREEPKCIQVGQLYGTEREPNSQARRIYDANGISPTMDTCSGGNRMPKVAIKQATKKGYLEREVGGVADLSYPDSKTRRARVQEDGKICPTLTATETGVCRIESDIRIRKLTPKECWRLMGFDDKSFEAAEQVSSNSQLYKQAGNSIVVDVLYYIFVELYKAMPYLFDNLKLSSFFSGIGAFEVALDRLYQGINEGNFIKGEE